MKLGHSAWQLATSIQSLFSNFLTKQKKSEENTKIDREIYKLAENKS